MALQQSVNKSAILAIRGKESSRRTLIILTPRPTINDGNNSTGPATVNHNPMEQSLVGVSEFNSALWNRFNDGKIRNVYPKAKYNHIIKKIKSMEDIPPVNSPGEYYLLRKFIVAKVGDEERLACKNLNAGVKNGYVDAKSIKFYIALEEIHRFLEEAHSATNHGGRDRIIRFLQDQGVCNIARDTVELYLSFCNICRPRQKEVAVKKCIGSKMIAVKPVQKDLGSPNLCDTTMEDSITIEPADHNSRTLVIENDLPPQNVSPPTDTPSFKRGHVAILDLTASPDGDYRFILVYLDYQTQFTILRPVKCKCTYEVSSHLLDIFTFIGPPQILHGDYDSPFLLAVIQTLKQSWPECVIVHSRNNDNVDIAKQCIADIETMLKEWIGENNSHRWSFGLRFVQLRKNTKISGENGKSPYERFFGKPLQTFSYFDGPIDKEEDLINASAKQRSQENGYEELQVSLDPNICSLVQNNFRTPSPTDGVQDRLYIDTSIVKVEPADSE